MSYTVVFAPEAEVQLAELFRYIAGESSPDIALRYTEGIVTYCESLHIFPVRGMARDDLRPGLRITSYRKRVVIAFQVEESRVNILGIFYGGRDYEAVFEETE
ncbi:MAG TPA: type II toxin-antitoxin system RelE/ParE family toxin [Edaphobacter sp.]